MDDEPDTDRRALIGLAACVPVVGGVAGLLLKVIERPAERAAARWTTRAIQDTRQHPQIPAEKVAQAVSDRDEGR